MSYVFSTFRRRLSLKKFCFGGHWVIGVIKIGSYDQKSGGLNLGGGLKLLRFGGAIMHAVCQYEF